MIEKELVKLDKKTMDLIFEAYCKTNDIERYSFEYDMRDFRVFGNGDFFFEDLERLITNYDVYIHEVWYNSAVEDNYYNQYRGFYIDTKSFKTGGELFDVKNLSCKFLTNGFIEINEILST